MNIKMIVATHRAYTMSNDDIYLPVHVGRHGKDYIGFIGDDTGNNISSKNLYYCELTGLYWAWKNLECDVIGLVHYRRYFGNKVKGDFYSGVMNRNEIENLLSTYDLILPKKRNYYIEDVETHFNNHLRVFTEIDYMRFARMAIEAVTPEYSNDFNICVKRKSSHMCNMFVMKKKIFNSYSFWLFSILGWMENNHSKYTRIEPYKRIYGFIGELLLDVWVLHNNCNFCEANVISPEKDDKVKKVFNFAKRKFLGIP